MNTKNGECQKRFVHTALTWWQIKIYQYTIFLQVCDKRKFNKNKNTENKFIAILVFCKLFACKLIILLIQYTGMGDDGWPHEAMRYLLIVHFFHCISTSHQFQHTASLFIVLFLHYIFLFIHCASQNVSITKWNIHLFDSSSILAVSYPINWTSILYS